MLHSISDLTTFCRKTTGDVPPKLVGASTTVVGAKMYLFGGRLVAERRMVSDLYVFDLDKLHWTKVHSYQDEDAPRARYFHSADTWKNCLVIFGGMSNKLESINPDDLCVLNDVRYFDLSTNRWLPASASNSQLASLPLPENPADSTEPTDPDSLLPRARYAHLSSVTGDRLFIIGGQDFFNVWLDDVCIYDMRTKMWVQRSDYPRHCGTYRSVAVSSPMRVNTPQDDAREADASLLGPSGTRFIADSNGPPVQNVSPSESLIHLPYSTLATPETPSDIYLYSNYNFTDVKRELEVFSPQAQNASNSSSPSFTISDRSNTMKGNSFPPGLRFPTGAILGNHFIIAGTYLAHTYQSFSIWALDLVSMTWSRIDPGNAVATGSWARGCLYAEANRFLIFGNRNGNLVDDYTRRLLSWDHVAVVDLEAFGIYQAPRLQIDISMQELGLAALEEHVNTDFEIICDDGRKVPCSRKILETRWPWFKEQRRRFVQLAIQTIEQLPVAASAPFTNTSLPLLLGEPPDGEERPDPRLTPRALKLSEPYPITLALLQYFYSLALLTPLQHAPAVLSQLLVLSATYEMKHLETLVKHAMHRALSNSTSVGVYEVATLCSCRSLQIRALKTVMSYSQKRPSRSRQDKDADGDGGRSRHGGGQDPGHSSTTRPRGTSDAYWRGMGHSNGTGNDGNLGGQSRDYVQRNVGINDLPFDPWEEANKLLENGPDDHDEQFDAGILSARKRSGGLRSSKRPGTSPGLSSPWSPSSSSSILPTTVPPDVFRARLARRRSVCTIVENEIVSIAELMSPHIYADNATTRSRITKKSSFAYSHTMSSPSQELSGSHSFTIATDLSSTHTDTTDVSCSSEYDDRDSYFHSSDESLSHNYDGTPQFNSLSRRPSDAPSTSSSIISELSPVGRLPPLTPISPSHPGGFIEYNDPPSDFNESLYCPETEIIELALDMPDVNEVLAKRRPPLKNLDVDLAASLSLTSLPRDSSSSSTPSLTSVLPARSKGPSSFAKIFGVGKKADNKSVIGDIGQYATESPSSQQPLSLKEAKALEKKRKKNEAKIRTERLAQDLKMRKQNARETSSQHSSEEKKQPKDMASMYSFQAGMLGC